MAQTDVLLSGLEGTMRQARNDVGLLGTSSAVSELMDNGRIDPEKIAEFMQAPTQVTTEKLYPLNAYGSAMAPLFISLSLWIGTLMLCVILKLEVDKAYKKRRRQEEKKQLAQDLSPARQLSPQIQGIRYDNVRSAMAEEGLLRQVLKEPELLRDIGVTPEQFSSPLLGRAFAALQRQHAQGQMVTLSSLGEEFTPQEMSHLSQVAQRRDTTLSEQALKDYIRIITEEYANARLSGPEGLLQLAQRKKRMEHGG